MSIRTEFESFVYKVTQDYYNEINIDRTINKEYSFKGNKLKDIIKGNFGHYEKHVLELISTVIQEDITDVEEKDIKVNIPIGCIIKFILPLHKYGKGYQSSSIHYGICIYHTDKGSTFLFPNGNKKNYSNMDIKDYLNNGSISIISLNVNKTVLNDIYDKFKEENIKKHFSYLKHLKE